ncbi:MFS transporter [Halioxenophilus sp. WMMB6]|uniref:MFS transporter n=1 Tax=Halioxenophilus sp. WMMB6 TaxID=3073815 RepID=UPI00295EE7B3|nr:MFS transporter [Halioxenophilus sp. WMMB6]
MTESTAAVSNPLATEPDSARVSQKVMILYGLGQTGAQLFRDAPAVLLPLFMTTMLGISPWLAGIVVLIPKMWVIFCDPIMGSYSDHLKPKVARRPFLAGGAILTSLTFIALFAFSGFPSPTIAALVVGIVFFIASTAFSAFSVPYLAVASELSSDPHERTKILSVRIVFAVVGVIMGVGLAQPLVFMLGGDAAAWRTMAIIFGTVCLGAMLATAYGVPKDFGAAHHSAAKSVRERFAVVRENKPFIVMTLTYLVQSIGQASSYAVVGFIFLYAVGDINLLLPFVLVMSSGSISSQPVWLKISRKIGKEGAFWLACGGWILVTITWFWLEPGTDKLATLPVLGEVSTQDLLVLVRAFIIGCTNAGFSVLSFSLLTDTISRQKALGKSVDEGLFSGIFSAVEKLGFALGPMLAGLVLSIAGFESSVGGAVDQDAGAVKGMILCYSLIPATILGLSLLVFTQYKKAMHQA